jgi:hypothetical protein
MCNHYNESQTFNFERTARIENVGHKVFMVKVNY